MCPYCIPSLYMYYTLAISSDEFVWLRAFVISYWRFFVVDRLSKPTNRCQTNYSMETNVININVSSNGIHTTLIFRIRWLCGTQIAKFMGQHEAHLGPVGPRWAPWWPHEACYQGCFSYRLQGTILAQVTFMLAGCLDCVAWRKPIKRLKLIQHILQLRMLIKFTIHHSCLSFHSRLQLSWFMDNQPN